MASAAEPRLSRVRSPDGTEIGFWTSGEGPPLVLVHGTASNRGTWQALLPHLEPHVATHAVDRRGRGASGDNSDYDIAREFDDLVAVIDEVARASGATVSVLGHSFGGLCALGAAERSTNLGKLLLYEPQLRREAPDTEERVAGLLAQGDDDAALEAFYRDIAFLTPREVEAFRAIPGWWESRLATVHTIPREMRAPAWDMERAARIATPTVVLLGSESAPETRRDMHELATSIPSARLVELEGQQHVAHTVVPDVFAGHVLAFLHDPPA